MQRLTWLVGLLAIVALGLGCGGGTSNYRIPTGDNVQPFAAPEEEDLTGQPAAAEPDTGWDGQDDDEGEGDDADKTKAGEGAGASKTAPPEEPAAKAPAKAPAGKAPAKAPAPKAPAKTPVKPK